MKKTTLIKPTFKYSLLFSLIFLNVHSAHASIVRGDINYQYFRDFAENKGQFALGATNVEIFDKNGQSVGTMLKDVPMIDFSAISRGNGYATLVKPQYIVSVQHNRGYQSVQFGDHSNVNPDSHHFDYQIANRHITAPGVEISSWHRDDYHTPRLHKLVTEVVPMPTSDETHIREFTNKDKYTIFVRAGSGVQEVIDVKGGTARNVAGAYRFVTGGSMLGTPRVYNNSAIPGNTPDTFLRFDGPNALFDQPMSSSQRSGDSGSGVFAWDAQAGRWVYVASAQSSTVANTFVISHLGLVDKNEQLSIAGTVIGNEQTLLWTPSANSSTLSANGQELLNVGLADENLAERDGVNNGHWFRPRQDHGKTFTISGENNTLRLADNIDQGAGAIYFTGNTTVEGVKEGTTWLGAGVSIDKDRTVTWKVGNPDKDRLSKIGEGTLLVQGVGKNLGSISVGDGTVILDQRADVNNEKQSFSEVGIVSGRSTVVLNSADQVNPDNIYFGFRGGRLDVNGNDLTFNRIQNADEGARIVNHNLSKATTVTVGKQLTQPLLTEQDIEWVNGRARAGHIHINTHADGHTDYYVLIRGELQNSFLPAKGQSNSRWLLLASNDRAAAARAYLERENAKRIPVAGQDTFSGILGETDETKNNGQLNFVYDPVPKDDVYMLNGGANLNGNVIVKNGNLMLSGRPVPHAYDHLNRTEVIKDDEWLNRTFNMTTLAVQDNATASIGRNVSVVNANLSASQNAAIQAGFINGVTPVCIRSDYNGNTTCTTPTYDSAILDTVPSTAINGNVSLIDNATFTLGKANLTGKISGTALTTVNLSADSVWNMTADSDVGNLNLTAGSVVNLNNENNAQQGHYQTLNITGNLTGEGLFNYQTNLTQFQGDKVNVSGNASGTHLLNVSNTGTEPTKSKEHLTLLTVKGTDTATVKLSNKDEQVDLGAYRYSLRHEGEHYYLWSPVLEQEIDDETEKQRLAELARQAEEEEKQRQAELARQAEEAEKQRLAELARQEAERLERERQAELARQAEEAEKQRLAELARQEAERLERERQAELARQAEEAEKQRLAELARQAEEAEKQRLAELARQAEEAEKQRLAEEAEKQRLAELARQAEEAEKQRLAELARQEAERLERERQAELARQAEEEEKQRLAELTRQAEEAEKQRLAELARQAEEAEKQRLAELARQEAERLERERQAELARQAEEAEKQRLAELARQEAERLERERQAELARQAEEAEKQRLAELARQAEEAEKQRLAELARQAEEAEKQRQAELARQAEEAEKQRLAELARQAEEAEKQRLAELARQAEEAEKQRLAELARQAEEAEKQRLAELARQAEEAEKQRQAELARQAEEAEKQRLAELARQEAERLERERQAELARQAEEAEKQRLAELARQAEEAEKQRLVELARQAEEAEKQRLAELARQEAERLEKERQAELARQAEEAEKQRLAELARQEAERLERERQAELARQAEEAEKQRLAELARQAEEAEKQRLAELARQAEEAEKQRLAELARQAEEAEKQRLAELTRQAEEAEKQRLAELTRQAEEAEKQRLAELARQAEEAEKQRQAELARQAEEAEKQRLAELARQAEEAEKQRLAELARQAEEAEKQRLAELARQAEEAEKQRLAELARQAEEAEKQRQAELARQAEEAEKQRLAELARQEAERLERERQAELARQAEEAEKQRLAELARQAEEAEKQRLVELARQAEEAEKQRLAELARQEAERLEKERQAELARQAEEAEKQRLAELARQEAERLERERQAELARQAEEAEKQRLAELARQAEEAEKQRLAELARQAEEAEKQRLAELARQAEEAEKQRLAELTRQAEEAEKQRLAELARQAEEAEKQRQAELARQAEEAEKQRLAELARQAEEAEKQRLAELARQAEEAEKQRLAELARQAEEEAKRQEEQRQALAQKQQSELISRYANTALSDVSSQVNSVIHVGDNLNRHLLDDSHTGGVWLNVNRYDETEHSSSYYRDYKKQETLTQIGADTTIEVADGQLLIGTVYSHSESNNRFDDNASSDSDLDVFSTYGKLTFKDDSFITADVGYGRTDSTIRSEGEEVKSKRHIGTAGLNVGKTFKTEVVDIQPSVGVRYHYLEGHNYNLNGANVEVKDANVLSYRAGVSLEKSFILGNGIAITPSISSSYVNTTNSKNMVSVNNHSLKQEFGDYGHHELGVKVGGKQWAVEVHASRSEGNEVNTQNAGGMKFSYKW